MKKILTLSLMAVLLLFAETSFSQKVKKNQNPNVDYRIDNMGYWNRMAKKGYVPVAPDVKPHKAIYKGSQIVGRGVLTDDSPDVMITGEIEQTENSVFIDPSNNSKVLNSNNSGNSGSFYGTSYLITEDASQNPWGGSVQSTGGSNNGDPASTIGLNGRMYNGFIHSNSGQGVAYSDNGVTWTSIVAGTAGSGGMLDKNHLWIDNNTNSPYEGYVYDAWTDFGGGGGSGFDNNIGFVHSSDGGVSYSSPINLSSAVNAGSHNQGVNISTGPNGEVYVVWAIYDSWPSPETSLGFAKSLDGGATFDPATRIISNINGIRDQGVQKNMRVNSFPIMSVNQQNGEIYIVWSNIGVPGTNTGSNISVYMIKSSDLGSTWSSPIRVNQGSDASGKEAYLPWITCDTETGTVSVIYFDDRDVSSTQVETWVSNSFDGGDTWEALRVSDVAFTPSPLPGMADGYMGDYLGISAQGGIVYPVWSDNRTGSLFAYCSPFETNNLPRPENLVAVVDEPTGLTDLTWEYNPTKDFSYFIVYRDGVQLATTTELTYQDQLPDYGTYNYSVTAMHDEGESSGSRSAVTWGAPSIVINPTSLSETLLTNQLSTKVITVSNIGHLGLTYNTSTQITSKDVNAYCAASGGGDEYISGVEMGTISNTGTDASGYSDYTAMATDIDAGNSYDIIITNGNSYSSDDLGIWIDLNHDDDFDDAGENVLCTSGDGAQGTYNITIPDDALAGPTVMRIRMKYSGSDCGDPCGTTTYGEVEDYTLNINSWLQVEANDTEVAPGNSANVLVTFNSTDLAEGTYTANLNFTNNDPNNSSIDVPVTLIVSATAPLNSDAYAENSYACSGSEVQLFANATGGSGVYTYSWTSNPAGFTSSEANPMASPTVDTEYFVDVNDGTNNNQSSYSITIQSTPNTANIPDGDATLCQDGANSLYESTTVDGATSYVWNLSPANAGTITGDGIIGTVDWDANFAGSVEVSISAVNRCGEGSPSAPFSVSINELPTVTIASVDDVCIDAASFTLPQGEPTGGTYSGDGVSGSDFDPAVAGVGVHTITYTYSNGTCENMAQTTVTVNELPTVTLTAFENIALNEASFELTGGNPTGGIYSGTGVVDGYFDPAVAGIGTHTITYTYVDGNSCENLATQDITVDESNGISTIVNGITVKIYPNPNAGQFILQLNSENIQNITVNVVNNIGMTVYQNRVNLSNSNTSNIDLSEFSDGIYFIKILGANINLSERVVIQK